MSRIYRCLHLLVIIVIGLTIFGPDPAAAQPQHADLAAQIDTYMEDVLETIRIPGAAVAVVNSQGFIHLQGYGSAAPGRAVTPQTPFWIASLSKPFTALAVRQLVNAGKLDLDAPVQQYIPWFTLAEPQAATKIKVHHLIDHASGIPGEAGGEIYFNASPRDSAEDLVRGLKDVTPKRVGMVEYSNYNYVILAYLIELVTGRTYEQYMRENVLHPLGMAHTHFSDRASKADGGMTGYRYLFGLPVPWDEAYKPSMHGAGYIISSAEDMGRLAMLYLNDGKAADAYLTGAAPETTEGYYSIYWQWISGPSSGSTPQHEGGMRTTSSAISIYPDQDLAVVVLLNCRPDFFYSNMNAMKILVNVTAIVNSSTPNPPDNRGWSRSIRAVNILGLKYLAAVVVSFMLTLLWKKRGLHIRWLSWAAGILALLETVLVLFGLIATPVLNHASWVLLLKIAPDQNGMVLVLAVLFSLTAWIKIRTLWGLRGQPVRRHRLIVAG